MASELSRVPPFNTGDLDMTLLLLRAATLDSKMSHMVMECVESAQVTFLNVLMSSMVQQVAYFL